jgi:hypothetical protein
MFAGVATRKKGSYLLAFGKRLANNRITQDP